MNKRTKLILSVIGALAVVVPVVLLLTLGSKAPQAPGVSSEKRNIDTKNVGEVARRAAPSPVALPSPSPSTESASPASSPSPSPEVEEEEDLE